MRFATFILAGCTLFLGACELGGPTVAVVDVKTILAASPHAKEASEATVRAQTVCQENLDTISRKLSAYKNRKLADEYLKEATDRLQQEFDTTRLAVAQAMSDRLQRILDSRTNQYDLIVSRGSLLAHRHALDITASVQEEYDRAEVVWPVPPRRVENPQLPADAGDAPASPAAEKTGGKAGNDAEPAPRRQAGGK
ncbi:MAG: hypothetical protein PUB01_03565 [Desulfovibrionaceae bacterium]|nr:hypothetical protein [Desulfovibrionaceae bacterium]